MWRREYTFYLICPDRTWTEVTKTVLLDDKGSMVNLGAWEAQRQIRKDYQGYDPPFVVGPLIHQSNIESVP